MSRIGKKPINIPEGVTVSFNNNVLTAKGPKGEQSVTLLDTMNLDIQGDIITVNHNANEDDKNNEAFRGLTRSLVNNCVIGVHTEFEKRLDIIGVGYRAIQQNADVQFQLGYSHNIVFSPPQGVTVEVMEATKLKVRGINKQQVGQVAANIRKLRPPEPYKGKGIRYTDEYVRRKAGKTGK